MYIIVDNHGLKQNGRFYLTCRTFMQQTWFVNGFVNCHHLYQNNSGNNETASYCGNNPIIFLCT